MVDDGWEPIDSGWEPITQDAPAGPLAQLSQQVPSAAPVIGAAEGVASFGTSLAAPLVGGLAGLGTEAANLLGLTDKTGADVSTAVSDALTYHPETKGGEGASDVLGYPFRKLAEVGDTAAQHILDAKPVDTDKLPDYAKAAGWLYNKAAGSPEFATAATTAVQMLPTLLGGGEAKVKAVEHLAEPPAKAVEAISETSHPDAAALTPDELQGPDSPLYAKPENFTAEQRRKAQIDAIPDLTDEQRAKVAEQFPVTKDRVMGFDRPEELEPTIKAAQDAGDPAAYGEIDVRNLGGLNAHMKSNAKADVHLKAVADILRDEADKSDASVALIRKSHGDEIGAIFHGTDKAGAHEILSRAQARIEDYAKEQGLDQIPHHKVGEAPGFGIHFGTEDITPGRSIKDIVVAADSLVEARKKGASYEQRSTPETVGSGQRAAGEPVAGVDETARTDAGTAAPAGRAAPADAERPTGQVDDNPARVSAIQPDTGQIRAAAGDTGQTVREVVGTETPARTVPGSNGTEVRNTAVNAQREALNLDAIPQAEREHWQAPEAAAREKIAQDPHWPRTVAAEVAAKPRALTTTETMGLAHDLKSLTAEHAKATRDVLKAREAGDPIAEAHALQRQHETVGAMEANHAALREGGTHAARGLAIRNAILKDDYTIGRNMDRAKASFGENFNEGIRKQVEDLSARLQKAEETIAEQAKGKTTKPKPTPDEAMQAKVQKQIDSLQARIEKRLKACPL